LLMLFLLAACAQRDAAGEQSTPTASPTGVSIKPHAQGSSDTTAGPGDAPAIDLTLNDSDVTMAPLPLRAGVPFSVTAVIHNNADLAAVNVPVMIYVSAGREEIGYSSFVQVLTVTVPASGTLPLELPLRWNFAGGEHQLWVQVNHLPELWQTEGGIAWPHPIPTLPEANIGDNIVLRQVMIDPFSAYVSDLCPGRVDVEIRPEDVLPEPDRQRVFVRVHNAGNRAVYNVPIVVLGNNLSGIAYTPAIPPCGGTAELYVDVDRPFEQGETLSVQVNPSEWSDSLVEDNFDNNQVSVSAGLAPGMVAPPGSGLEDYDFSLSTADIETPELWIVLVTVHNLGTRDAAMVPIRIENASGRKLTDAIPLVQGNGTGVAAIRVGYLWTRGGTLTFTVNPEGSKGGYPETNRENNVATFTLP
jgi:hypothetical protein